MTWIFVNGETQFGCGTRDNLKIKSLTVKLNLNIYSVCVS